MRLFVINDSGPILFKIGQYHSPHLDHSITHVSSATHMMLDANSFIISIKIANYTFKLGKLENWKYE